MNPANFFSISVDADGRCALAAVLSGQQEKPAEDQYACHKLLEDTEETISFLKDEVARQ